MINKFVIWFCVALLCLLPEQAQLALPYPQVNEVDVLVLDAGHGGKDSGAVGYTVYEKNVTLGVILKAGKLIEEAFPEIKVVYTRNTDVFIPLDDRAKIANENKADLFISVHCNSLPAKTERIHGTEVYVMGNHVTKENLRIAARENESILFETDYKTTYDGYDPNSPVAHIVFSMFQNAYREKSVKFAEKIQHHFNKLADRNKRGVHEAGFLVLRKTAMPSVLIETGYLTHKEEDGFLGSQAGQWAMAEGIFQSFRQYKSELDGKDYSSRVPTYKSEPLKPKEVKVAKPAKEKTPAPEKIPTPKAVTVAVKDTVKVIEATTLASPKNIKPIQYKIQIATSDKPKKGVGKELDFVKIIEEEFHKNTYKYMVADFEDYKSAQEALVRIKAIKGFEDAFLVKYIEGKR